MPGAAKLRNCLHTQSCQIVNDVTSLILDDVYLNFLPLHHLTMPFFMCVVMHYPVRQPPVHSQRPVHPNITNLPCGSLLSGRSASPPTRLPLHLRAAEPLFRLPTSLHHHPFILPTATQASRLCHPLPFDTVTCTSFNPSACHYPAADQARGVGRRRVRVSDLQQPSILGFRPQ